MLVNPITLQEESEQERLTRQKMTGQLGNGLVVLCRPTADPEVVQQQPRAMCLKKPYFNCHTCPHSSFTLVFKKKERAVIEECRRQLVLCPRWEDRGYVHEKVPDSYVSVEEATCELMPFDFCRDCPAVSELVALGIDKAQEGWYSRWKRFTKEEEEEDDG